MIYFLLLSVVCGTVGEETFKLPPSVPIHPRWKELGLPLDYGFDHCISRSKQISSIDPKRELSKEENEAIDKILKFYHPESSVCWYIKFIGKNPKTDLHIYEKYGKWVKKALECKLEHWRRETRSLLALIVLADQFIRNIFRDSPQQFLADFYMQKLVQEHRTDFDQLLGDPFGSEYVYFPMLVNAHSENLTQNQVNLGWLESAQESSLIAKDSAIWTGHLDNIRQFGRHPYRAYVYVNLTQVPETMILPRWKPNPSNPTANRNTPEEIQFMKVKKDRAYNRPVAIFFDNGLKKVFLTIEEEKDPTLRRQYGQEILEKDVWEHCVRGFPRGVATKSVVQANAAAKSAAEIAVSFVTAFTILLLLQ